MDLAKVGGSGQGRVNPLYGSVGELGADYVTKRIEAIASLVEQEEYAKAFLICTEPQVCDDARMFDLLVDILESGHTDLTLQEYCKKSACANTLVGLISLLSLSFKGEKVWDIECYVTNLEKFAKSGSCVAMNVLGHAYRLGCGVKVDYDKALEYYTQSADKGSRSAKYSLALAYKDGIGVTKNSEEAFRRFKEAADQGNVLSMLQLGYMCENGEGTKQSAKTAFFWFGQAAFKKNSRAMYDLGRFYCRGWEGNKPDLEQAHFWSKESQIRGFNHALNWLGIICIKLKKPFEARVWFELASSKAVLSYPKKFAELCNGNAKLSQSTNIDYLRASELAGISPGRARLNLGLCWLNNKGVEKQSHSMARVYLNDAYKLGDPEAAFWMGESFRNAGMLSGRQDDVKAQKWYKRAAQFGSKCDEAKRILAECYSDIGSRVLNTLSSFLGGAAENDEKRGHDALDKYL